MRSLQPVRGTQDLLPETARRHRHISETARDAAELYGFAEIATPIFEFTEVFSRPIGETSDIVTKEMYSFVDRGGEAITLRPENTAGVVRAVLSDGLLQSMPLKFFYAGPMFRYERPQKGRFRQFHQIGVELIGVAQPQADIEVIALGSRVLEVLGIGQRVTLELNTLGDPASRCAYREALVAYFSKRISELSEDSRRRLERNPLRIFDSKEESDRRVSIEAPVFDGFLNADSCDFFFACAPGPRPAAHRISGQLATGTRSRLLQPYRLRIRHRSDLGSAGNSDRRWALRRAHRGPWAVRPPPGVGWAAGDRAAGDADRRAAAAAHGRLRWSRSERQGSQPRCSWRKSCVAAAFPSISAIPATSRGVFGAPTR